MGGTRIGVVAAGVAAVLAWTPAGAAPYTAEYVFGDSLSDNGNLAAGLFRANFPNPPSYHDSFSNGPVANELLAGALGLTLTPSLWVTGFRDADNLFGGGAFVPGTNYAVAGATAAPAVTGGVSPLINLPQQVAAYGSTTAAADPGALYVVEIGGNDIRLAARNGTGAAAVAEGVRAELGAVGALVAKGARNLLVVDAPDVGVIPEFTALGSATAAAATQASVQYDAQLLAGLATLPLPSGTNLTTFDLLSYNRGLLANASAYGITNTTVPCYTATPLSAATTAACGAHAENIGQFAYWDAIHPTARLQSLWAAGFESAIGVPEPSSLAVLGVGLLGSGFLGATGRARRQRTGVKSAD